MGIHVHVHVCSKLKGITCHIYVHVCTYVREREEGERERERERERAREKVSIFAGCGSHTFTSWRITFCFDILNCTIICSLIGRSSGMKEKTIILNE